MAEHSGHRLRLRQHFMTNGIDALRDYEVLELLLCYAIPRRDVQPLARELLEHFGSLASVLEATPEELRRVAPLCDNAIVLLQLINPLSRRYLQSKNQKAVILRDVQDTCRYLHPYFFGQAEEILYILCLDAKNKLLTCRLLQQGSVNSVNIPFRKAAEIAIGCKASAVILAHNHPCGTAFPSEDDCQTTERLRAILEPMEITLADHFIFAGDSYFSMFEHGYLH